MRRLRAHPKRCAVHFLFAATSALLHEGGMSVATSSLRWFRCSAERARSDVHGGSSVEYVLLLVLLVAASVTLWRELGTSVRCGLVTGNAALSALSEDGGRRASQQCRARQHDPATALLQAPASGHVGSSFGPRTAGAAQHVRGKIVQSGGHTISRATARALNQTTESNLTEREWGRGLEALKKELDLPNNHHGKITEYGHYLDDHGNVLGNILEYL